MAYEGLLAETVYHKGYGGDEIEAYMARPLGPGKFPGVVVIHHMPGWDAATKEITRRFAHNGYIAIDPNLYTREGPGEPDDVAAVARAAGGAPDTRVMGDVDGAADHIRTLPYHNGKIGVIGFCSGGRQTYLAACTLNTFDAAVDCWGGRVIAPPEQLTERQPVAPIEYTADLSCPLLGIFGQDDMSPAPEDVDLTEVELKKHGKEYEFHRYEGAAHGFFAVDRPGYRPVQATEAWVEVFKWFGKHLAE
jgi:carboxymethylenebutenolidase